MSTPVSMPAPAHQLTRMRVSFCIHFGRFYAFALGWTPDESAGTSYLVHAHNLKDKQANNGINAHNHGTTDTVTRVGSRIFILLDSYILHSL